MKVADLRALLESRQLAKTGNKAALIERLEEDDRPTGETDAG